MALWMAKEITCLALQFSRSSWDRDIVFRHMHHTQLFIWHLPPPKALAKQEFPLNYWHLPAYLLITTTSKLGSQLGWVVPVLAFIGATTVCLAEWCLNTTRGHWDWWSHLGAGLITPGHWSPDLGITFGCKSFAPIHSDSATKRYRKTNLACISVGFSQAKHG